MAEFFHILVRTSVDDIVQKFGLYYEATTGGTGPRAAQSAAEAWRVQCIAPLQAMLSNEARVESIYCRKVDGTTVPAWRGNLNNAVGGISGNALPAQNACLINLRNTLGLLDRPGRIFVSGLAINSLVNGTIENIITGPLITAFATAIMTIPAGGAPPWSGELRVRRTVIAGVPQIPPVYVAVDATDFTLELGTQHQRKGELTGFQA